MEKTNLATLKNTHYVQCKNDNSITKNFKRLAFPSESLQQRQLVIFQVVARWFIFRFASIVAGGFRLG